MENIVYTFLNEFMPEEKNTYLEIISTIIGIDDKYSDDLEFMIGTLTDDSTVDDIVITLREKITSILKKLLEEIGFFVSEDYLLDNEILFRIYIEAISLENNEMTEFLLSILESEDDPVTVFWDMMTIVGSLDISEDDYYKHISSVSLFTRSKLKTLLENKVLVSNQDNVEDKIIRDECVLRVKDFISKLDTDDFFMIDKIKEGIMPGLYLDNYLDLFFSELADLDLKDTITNLYICGLMSRDCKENILKVIESKLGNYIYNISQVEIILRGLQEIYSKVGER